MIVQKRGQTEVSFGTLLLIIIGVIGLILVGMFIWNTYGKISDLSDLTPTQLVSAATICKQQVSVMGQTGFCNDFKKITEGGKEYYYNCRYVANLTVNASNGATPSLDDIKKEWGVSDISECSSNVVTNKCEELKQLVISERKNIAKVNEKTWSNADGSLGCI